MRSKFTPIYTTFLLLFIAFLFLGNSNNPPNGYTNAPGDGLCTICHTPGNPQGFDGQIIIENFPGTIMPDTDYPITIRVTNPNGLAFRGGFQAVVLNSSNNNSGNITVSGSNPTTQTSGGREYVEHNPAINFPPGNEVTWNFTWTSPAGPPSENITMYAAGNIASGGNGNQQDLIVTTTASGTLMSGGDPLEVTIVASQNVSCNGGNDGSATASASGGTMPYSYNWSSGSNSATANNLSAGVYTVTATDALSETATAMVTITEPSQLVASINSQSNITCDNPVGSATASGAGGTPPYSYSWSSGGNGTTETFLNPGTYTVSVLDNNFCLDTETVTILQDIIPPIANAGTDGQLDCNTPVLVLNGAGSSVGPEFIYLWTTSNGNIMAGETTLTPTINAPGTYTLTVTNQNNGCTASNEVLVIEIPGVNLFITGIDVSCFGGNDGSINLTVTGGQPPFNYDWNDDSIDGMEDPSGLSAGNYCVTVSDDNNCTATDCIEIFEPSEIVITAFTTDVLCFGSCDGNADLTVSGGTPPYNFLWDDPGNQTTEDAVNLCADEYSVLVTDVNGCASTLDITISEPSEMTLQMSSTNETAPGENDGTATGTINGGVPGYTFLWDDPEGQVTMTAVGLAPGTYCVTVTDSNNCTETDCVVVNPGNCDLTATINTTDVSCNGGNDGSAEAIASGGSEPYSYNWSSGGNEAIENNLIAGSHSVTITDANNCEVILSFNIDEPPALVLDLTSTDETTNGAMDGTATATASGGTPQYTYLWDDNSTTPTIENLAPGNYCITVTDDNGCTISGCIAVNPGGCDLEGTIAVTNVLCNGGNDGLATVTASGGTSPYTYAWSSGGTEISEDSLSAGSYIVTIFDSNGCCIIINFDVTEPEILQANATATPVTCNGDCDGNVALNVTGGTAPYSFEWNNGSTQCDVPDACSGTYSVTITDSNSCTTTTEATVIEPPPLELDMSSTDETSPGANDGTATADVSGGTCCYTETWDTAPPLSGTTIENLSPGIYCVTITDANNCTISNCTQVSTSGCDLDLEISNVNLTCPGSCSGVIDLTVIGGEEPFVFEWNDNSIGNIEDPSDLCAGSYSVTVTDANDCSFTISTTVEAFPEMSLSFENTPASCSDPCGGAIDLMVDGGTTPFTYLWSNGETTEDIDSLCPGSYQVTVIDANGCTNVGIPTIVTPSGLDVLIVEVIEPTCAGECDGFIDIEVSGGTPPFTYVWSNGESTEDLLNVCTGNYTVEVIDSDGCSITASIVVSEPLPINISLNGMSATCFGECDGFVDVIVSGGTPPFTFIGQTDMLCAGDYTLTITDSNGCTAEAIYTISQPDEIVITIDEIGHETNGQGDGFIDITVNGGVPDYSYNWMLDGSTVSTDEDPSGLAAGTYILEVTDDNGCIVLSEKVLIDNLVAVVDPNLKDVIDIFPNPTQGLLQIKFDLNEFRNVEIEVFDCTGKNILNIAEKNVLDQRVPIDLSPFPEGVYTIKINIGDTFIVEQIVKQD